jgi:hypothetical protein
MKFNILRKKIKKKREKRRRQSINKEYGSSWHSTNLLCRKELLIAQVI